jgi:hypothetical protein
MAAIVGLLALLVIPTAVPAPAPDRTRGAIVVVAGNMDTRLLRQAGVTHVAVELTAENLEDLATSRWDGFVRGGFHVARDTDQESIRATARMTAALILSHRLAFLIEDTEAHKTDLPDGAQNLERLAWTDWLFAELRSQLGRSFPLYNVTFGLHSSPAVVNHQAFRRHDVTPIWEAYDEDGVTLGVGRTAAKAIDEGWTSPQIAIGDKSVLSDLPESDAQALGGVWLWAPDNGGTIEASPDGTTQWASQPVEAPTSAPAEIVPAATPCELAVVGSVCDAAPEPPVTNVDVETDAPVSPGVTPWAKATIPPISFEKRGRRPRRGDVHAGSIPGETVQLVDDEPPSPARERPRPLLPERAAGACVTPRTDAAQKPGAARSG